MSIEHQAFMRRAIALSARAGIEDRSGGVFGAVVVQGGEIIGEGWNRVVAQNDPTWHAEMAAIRAASSKVGDFDLSGATIYTSGEPCPMCMAAIYWARIEKVYYASTHADALEFGGFDDSFIQEELKRRAEDRKVPQLELLRDEALAVWKQYAARTDNTHY
ncbi:nucleoside deaminase [Cerasicoccus frondis]|uniref:nucleoside deaminase n=1 Tax=Cerasicoccus frondis TaxID=490090 RepID=UPI002852D4B0|nr:nucleoside deaminase [Cerasicoccus frondis]